MIIKITRILIAIDVKRTETVLEYRKENKKRNDRIAVAEFVSSLINENLIDEYYLFVNPVVIKRGLTIFDKIDDMKKFNLMESKSFDCGINLLCYKLTQVDNCLNVCFVSISS